MSQAGDRAANKLYGSLWLVRRVIDVLETAQIGIG